MANFYLILAWYFLTNLKDTSRNWVGSSHFPFLNFFVWWFKTKLNRYNLFRHRVKKILELHWGVCFFYRTPERFGTSDFRLWSFRYTPCKIFFFFLHFACKTRAHAVRARAARVLGVRVQDFWKLANCTPARVRCVRVRKNPRAAIARAWPNTGQIHFRCVKFGKTQSG